MKASTTCLFALVLVLAMAVPRPTTAASATVDRLRSMVDEASLKEGNEAYRQKDYERALSLYRKLLEHHVNGKLLYNAGNAAFKSGKLGWAVAYWMGAERFVPRDGDLAANLAFARSLRSDRVAEDREGASLGHLLHRAYRILTVSELQVLLFAMSWILAAFVVTWIFGRSSVLREIALWGGVLMLILSLACAVWTGMRTWDFEHRQTAVVLSDSLEAHSEPSPDSTRVFVLHEGTDVTLRRRSRDWVQVSLPNGFSGWVRSEGLVEIASLGRSS